MPPARAATSQPVAIEMGQRQPNNPLPHLRRPVVGYRGGHGFIGRIRLIKPICDVTLSCDVLFCSHGLLNTVQPCCNDIFLHDQFLPAAQPAARKCGHTPPQQEYERDILDPLATVKQEIDLDDGVRVNYPKIGAALKKIPGLDARGEE